MCARATARRSLRACARWRAECSGRPTRPPCQHLSGVRSVPARLLRIATDIVRLMNGWSPANLSISTGQHTMAGAFWSTPSSRSSATTPTISRHVAFIPSLTRLPMAACGVCQSSRARFSDTIATWRSSKMSVHVKSRPATRPLPIALKRPGDTILKTRSGGMRDSEYGWSSAYIASCHPCPVIGM